MTKHLRFGTSGLRDTVENMTDMECYINTLGFISFLREKGELGGEKPQIALAGDLRSSTPRIIVAVSTAIEDAGCSVMFCGMVPTPTLAYFATTKGVPSIMVTGSHIPDDRNGIKFTKTSGEVLKSDEADILRNVSSVREKGYPTGLFDDSGMFGSPRKGPEPVYEKEAEDLYVKRYTECFSPATLKGLKIVFYEHSAVGRDMLGPILESLGAEIVKVGRSEKFVPVDTEKVSEDTIKSLKQWADEFHPFAVVSTDGDSDRPLLADEKGDFLPGDKLGALVAIFLGADFAAVPISANDAVISALGERGIKVVSTKIGSPYVVRAMADELALSRASKVVGWESNGGFLLGSDWKFDSKELKALPTRDAVLPIVAALAMASEKKIPVSELAGSILPHRYTHAGVVDNNTAGCRDYTADVGKAIIKGFSPQEPGIKEAVFTEEGVEIDGRKVDEASEKDLLRVKEKLSRYFNEEGGFTAIRAINFIDGIRVAFAGGDVAHIRPSGNAPEFRLYATADTRERASEIVEQRKSIVPFIVKDIRLAETIIKAAQKGTPLYIRPHREEKVWGIKGIGEYWYGAEPEGKSSTVVLGDQTCLLDDVVSAVPQSILGEEAIKKFGPLVPLVKILTPKGRLSVQFHDSKNELWIVTGISEEFSGEKPSIIVGFSPFSVERYGDKVTVEYGKALKDYGAGLNGLINELESLPPGPREMLIRTRDAIKAAEYLANIDNKISNMLKELLKARERLEEFYNYRVVKPGDVVPVPSGTLHALGPGVEVVEPQIPGPTQSLEDGATFPVRYYFPGHERPGAFKKLDIDRVGEMRSGITPETLPEIIEEGAGYTVERLPGKFEDKGLEVRRVNMRKSSSLEFKNNSTLHSFVAVREGASIIAGGGKYPVPKAVPGGEMLIVPASCADYTVYADKETCIIDTFTPV